MLMYHLYSRRSSSVIPAFPSAKVWFMWLLVLSLIVLGLRPALATENDDRYFQIFGVIEKGEALEKADRPSRPKAGLWRRRRRCGN